MSPDLDTLRARMLAVLLAAVAGSAAVLSFSALHELAVLCGFTPGLAPLLPVVIDAGAAAGSLVWLTQPAGRARGFGRALALVLLVGSVIGNALSHGLAAYSARPTWWVVVMVSAIPPAVLGAVVHLAALVSQSRHTAPGAAVDELSEAPPQDDVEAPDWWATAPATGDEPDRATELIAAGAGRRRLSRELGVTEHQARELLAAHRVNGVAQ